MFHPPPACGSKLVHWPALSKCLVIPFTVAEVGTANTPTGQRKKPRISRGGEGGALHKVTQPGLSAGLSGGISQCS